MTTATTTVQPDDELLVTTQAQRMAIVAHLTKKELPEDPAILKVLLQTLDGVDKQVLGKKRLQVDEAGHKSQENSAVILANVLRDASRIKPFMVQTPVQRDAPKLGPEVPDPVLVDGETSTAPAQQSYDQFVAGVSSEDARS